MILTYEIVVYLVGMLIIVIVSYYTVSMSLSLSLSALYFPAQIQSSSATLDIEDPQKLFAKRLLERYERQLFVNAIVSFVCFLDLASPLSKL